MAITFPPSPSPGDVYTDPSTGRQWEWDGTVWNSVPDAIGSANQVIFNDALGDPTGSANLTFDGSKLTVTSTVAASTSMAIGQTSVAANTDLDLNGTYAQTIISVPALSIDCSSGNYFTKTISTTSTFTFDSVPSSRSYSFTLELTVSSGSVNWPGTVTWPGGSAPTLSTGKTHLLFFVTDDGGSRWRGSSLVDYTT
jgi:hypothetical protein